MSSTKTSRIFILLEILLLILLLSGCSDDRDDTGPVNTYRDNFTAENLLLTEVNHVDGWGRKDCLVCHPLINIPRHTGREEWQCMGCHGDNGSGLGNNLCLTCHQDIIDNRQHYNHLSKFTSDQNKMPSFSGFHNIEKSGIQVFNISKSITHKSPNTLIVNKDQSRTVIDYKNKAPMKNGSDDMKYFDYCFICHDGSGVGKNNHMNQHVDLFLSPDFGGYWNGSGCSGTFCHGSGNPVWNTTINLTCTDCHSYDSGNNIDFASGKHDSHVVDGGLSCDICHQEPSTHYNFTFDNPDNIVPDGGEYNDETPSGYSEDDSSGSCSGMTSQCHEGESQWKSGFACGTCHGVSASNPPQSGSHLVHAGSTGYSYSCSICHFGFNYGTPSHLNGQSDVGFDPDSLAGNNNPEFADSKCFNIYCHGAGTRELPSGEINSPTWGDPSTSYCGSCHGSSSETPPDSGQHPLHAGMLKFNCSTCHYATMEVDFKGYMPNGELDVVFPPSFTDASYENGEKPNTGTCMSVGCHNDRSWEE